jgi:hypothetical protein
MKNTIRILGRTAAIIAAPACQRTQVQSTSALRQVAAIRLPGVKGRIDHLAFDPMRQRLFVAALSNDTVEVLDTAKGAHLKSVGGFH